MTGRVKLVPSCIVHAISNSVEEVANVQTSVPMVVVTVVVELVAVKTCADEGLAMADAENRKTITRQTLRTVAALTA